MSHSSNAAVRARSLIGEPGLVVDGKYRLEHLLGKGGFGEVWCAFQEVEGQRVRSVALKLIKNHETGMGEASSGSGSGGESTQWVNEVRAVRNVKCESIAQVYDVGVWRERRLGYIAMQLLEGETLADRLAASPIYWRRALAMIRTIAQALHACHRVGVVHCDLKPKNVYITEQGQVYVLDFGIAALRGETTTVDHRAFVRKRPESGAWSTLSTVATMDGATMITEGSEPPIYLPPGGRAPVAPLIGTPGYMAPERYEGERPSPEADVFALGVLLYEMITGQLPHDLPTEARKPASGGTRDEYQRYKAAITQATTQGRFIPIASQLPDLPRAVCQLIDKLLSLSPEERPTDDLVAELDYVYRHPHGVPDPPYVGLESFDHRQTGFIFGRDSDVRRIITKLRAGRVVVLSGPSGCGKSSLARAGVAPAIDEAMLDGCDGWKTLVIRPGAGHHALRLVAEDFEPSPATLRSALGTVVVVDQFEEVLALDSENRSDFCIALRTLIEGGRDILVADRSVLTGDDPVRVIVTIRDDMFGQVAALEDLGRFPEQNLFTVRGVDPNAIVDIVQVPAAASGYRLEDAHSVMTEARRVLREDPSALPLVQFALTRWWEERDPMNRLLTRDTWREIGGIEGALAGVAQSLYEGFGLGQRLAMRKLLVHLFRLDGTRVRIADSPTDASRDERSVLAALIDKRLVRRHAAQDDERTTLEVVHEALARRWQPLRGWLEETRADRELNHELEYDAARWIKLDEPDALLWHGARLEQARSLPGAASREVASFVAAAVRYSRRRLLMRRSLIGTAIAGVTLLLALALAIMVTIEQRNEADQQRSLAEQATSELAVKNRQLEKKTTLEAELRQKAEDQAREARKQKMFATEKATEAVEARARVEQLHRLAKQRLVTSQQERDKANDQAREAEAQRRIAERERQNAAYFESKYKRLMREMMK